MLNSFRLRRKFFDWRVLSNISIHKIIETPTLLESYEETLYNVIYTTIEIDGIEDERLECLIQFLQLYFEYFLTLRQSDIEEFQKMETEVIELSKIIEKEENQRSLQKRELGKYKRKVQEYQTTLQTCCEILGRYGNNTETITAIQNAMAKHMFQIKRRKNEKEDVVSAGYICSLCNKVFISEGYLLSHRQRRHGGGMLREEEGEDRWKELKEEMKKEIEEKGKEMIREMKDNQKETIGIEKIIESIATIEKELKEKNIKENEIKNWIEGLLKGEREEEWKEKYKGLEEENERITMKYKEEKERMKRKYREREEEMKEKYKEIEEENQRIKERYKRVEEENERMRKREREQVKEKREEVREKREEVKETKEKSTGMEEMERKSQSIQTSIDMEEKGMMTEKEEEEEEIKEDRVVEIKEAIPKEVMETAIQTESIENEKKVTNETTQTEEKKIEEKETETESNEVREQSTQVEEIKDEPVQSQEAEQKDIDENEVLRIWREIVEEIEKEAEEYAQNQLSHPPTYRATIDQVKSYWEHQKEEIIEKIRMNRKVLVKEEEGRKERLMKAGERYDINEIHERIETIQQAVTKAAIRGMRERR